MNATDISSIVAVILALVAVIKGFTEGRKLNAETIKMYEEGANLNAKAKKELEEEVAEIKIKVDKLENWARRLVKQVQDLGGVPVPYELPRKDA